MTRVYKDTVFLPQTDFSMRANLAEKEPQILASWQTLDVYGTLRTQSAGKEKYIFHSGPPFANGNIHAGHMLTSILKDVVVRFKQMNGFDAHLTPGWDCHGLPIEWEIEKKYREEGKSKEQIPVDDFRKACRAFAQHWTDIQSAQFQRLGNYGDFKNPYSTMDFSSEAAILKELYGFMQRGSLYRGVRPILWSVAEKTALAEAEVEYKDHTSTTVFVGFTIFTSPTAILEGAKAVIWTTTPWTLPGNRAIAYGKDITYTLIAADETLEKSLAQKGMRLLIAKDLLSGVLSEAGITKHTVIQSFKGSDLEGSKCYHPLKDHGYTFTVPLVEAGYVTTEQGTGLVHTAPGHGEDDFHTGVKYNLEIPETVNDGGFYHDHVPLFKGMNIFKVNEPMLEALMGAGALLSKNTLVHSYPHSWRSKKPLIFRTIPQWFISLDHLDVRTRALEALESVRCIPASGKNRLASMIENRPSWCISRQRSWGVPIALFIHKQSKEVLKDPSIYQNVVKAFETEGADVWFNDPYAFLPSAYNKDDYEAVKDIVDVWFESGTTQSFVLQNRPELSYPADIYLEGSDQHRGWFQSSLLVAVGAGKKAPFKTLLTHGFVVDDKGYKMSKSQGNGLKPEDILQKYGADVLRLWTVLSDYYDDLRIGDEILKRTSDIYRRFRNTLRYLLGALHGYNPSEALAYEDMPILEKGILHRLKELEILAHETADSLEFQKFYQELHHFCAIDLSAFYFDVRKDSLYCDDATNLKRKAARTVFHTLFNALTSWLAPVLCFTAEEAYSSLNADPKKSIHFEQMPHLAKHFHNHEAHETLTFLREVRSVITAALELKRADKTIGSSLEARPFVYVSKDIAYRLEGFDLKELCIVSDIALLTTKAPEEAFTLEAIKDVAVVVHLAAGKKCERCWKTLEEVTETKPICQRCDDVVS